MMKWITFTVSSLLVASAAHAQPKKLEKSVEKQRKAVAAWTACIADENPGEVHELLSLDFKSKEYGQKINALSKKRVSSECFQAMPRSYRRIELGGLTFVGGLAERAIEASDKPLLNRLSMASIGQTAETYSYTDKAANCTIRGAPHLVAQLFESDVSSEAEEAALEQLQPVLKICTSQRTPIEASAFAMRSMLATASFRLLEAQKGQSDA